MCELPDANQCHETVQASLGANSAIEQYSSVVNLVMGSDLAYPDKVNVLLHDCTDTISDFIPIYDINYPGVEEQFAKSINHFNQFKDQSMVLNTESDIFRKWNNQIFSLGLTLKVCRKCLVYTTVGDKSLINF